MSPIARTSFLVVDDDPAIRDSLCDFFSEIGYGVRTAENGSAALSKIEQELPDIVLSELHMPDMSGFELLSLVHRFFPMVRTIAMSGPFPGSQVLPGLHADAIYRKGDLIQNLADCVETIAAQLGKMVSCPHAVEGLLNN